MARTAAPAAVTAPAAPTHPEPGAGLGHAALLRVTRPAEEAGGVRYVCQVTELAAGTTALAWGDPRHYVRDLIRGNVRLRPLLTGVSIAMFNWLQRTRGGAGYPVRTPQEQKLSPHEELNLQPGEVVRVKAKRDIERTLNASSRNRGLWFDGEMLRFCGGEFRVAARVTRLIDERTGTMLHLTTPCIILDGVTASGEYLGFCAQNEAIFWREIWLTRASSAPRAGVDALRAGSSRSRSDGSLEPGGAS